jgi:hypothetical protein
MNSTSKDPTIITPRKLAFNAAKAAIAGIAFYVIYILVWPYISPITQIIPSFQQTLQSFLVIYTALFIIGELTSGTIYQYFFNAGRALFVIGYLLLSLGAGTVNGTFENVTFFIDLHVIMTMVILLSLLGLAKSALQMVNFLGQKAEFTAAL